MTVTVENEVCLALDTSGRYGSVALGMGNRILGWREFSGMIRQSAELFISIQELLGQSGKKAEQIEHVYLTIGPGSFTGLRISATLAKMFAFCTNARVVCISTMEALAANAARFVHKTGASISYTGTILDAKRGQFYVAIFQLTSEGWLRVMEDSLSKSKDFLENAENIPLPIWLLGEGLVFYKKQFQSSFVEFIPESYWKPNACEVYRIGRKRARNNRFDNPVALNPLYLRGPDAIELKDRPSGR